MRLATALLLVLALAAPAQAQDTVPAVGGGSFNAAPQLDPDTTYRDSLLLGEYLYYAFPLEAGQRLHVQVRVPDTDEETWERGQDAFSINLHTPQRELVGTPVAEDVAGNGNTGGDDARRWDFYGPRAEPFLASAEEDNQYAGPGTWYVSVHSVKANDRDTVAELPIELTLSADGEPAAEAPDPTPTPSATPTAAPREDEDDGGGTSPLAMLGLGAAGLAVGLVAGRALARR